MLFEHRLVSVITFSLYNHAQDIVFRIGKSSIVACDLLRRYHTRRARDGFSVVHSSDFQKGGCARLCIRAASCIRKPYKNKGADEVVLKHQPEYAAICRALFPSDLPSGA